ncbi:cytochrome P450 [Alsobacter sp. R-9]
MSALAHDAPGSLAGPRVPPAPAPLPAQLPFWDFFRALRANPIAAWPLEAYEKPYLLLEGGPLRPDLLFVSDPAMVKRIFLDAVDVYDKGEVVRRRLRPFLGDGVLIAATESWRPQRRIAAPMFQARRVEAFFPDMLAAAVQEAERLEALGPDAVTDMHDALVGFTYDVIARTAFSADSVSDPHAFSRAIAAYFDTLGRLDAASYLNLPSWVPTLGRLRAMPSLALFRREIGGIIARRRKRLEDEGAPALPDDLLTRLLTSTDPQTGQTLSPERVYDNAVTFLAAGHETTANVLAWTLFLLSENPEWDDRVVHEIRREVPDGVPTPAALARLEATRMVVDEAMRLYPPAPLIPRMPLSNDRLGPVDVRAGTIVITAPFVSHRHRAHWDEPDAFRPERFAPGRREAVDRYVYFPFGVGPRVCIGATFAVQEALTALAVLLPRLRFVATAPQDVFPQATITLRPGSSLPMRLEPRAGRR